MHITDAERKIVEDRVKADDVAMDLAWNKFKLDLPDKFKDWPPDHILLVRSVFEVGWMMGIGYMAEHPLNFSQIQ